MDSYNNQFQQNGEASNISCPNGSRYRNGFNRNANYYSRTSSNYHNEQNVTNYASYSSNYHNGQNVTNYATCSSNFFNENMRSGVNNTWRDKRNQQTHVNKTYVKNDEYFGSANNNYHNKYLRDNNFSTKNYRDHNLMRSRGKPSGRKYYNSKEIATTKNEVEPSCQREYLISQLNKQKYECMICVTSVKRNTAIWSCGNCYHIFHIACIRKWATSCLNGENNQSHWRCPACQETYETADNSFIYVCFCGKTSNPEIRKSDVPHACGTVCGKANRNLEHCPHTCVLLCHPGPCPSCEASINRNCHCGRTRMTVRCTAESVQLSCGEKCGKQLQCGKHFCERVCHDGDCGLCEVEVKKTCWCSRRNLKSVLCGSEEATNDRFCCGELCELPKDCGKHFCKELCHDGSCPPCDLVPEKVLRCCCGKKTVVDLEITRMSCEDPLPCCESECSKVYSKCGHLCKRKCHQGECGPCPLSREVRCLCGMSVQSVECSNDCDILCRSRCRKKLSCGRHRCQDVCCNKTLHICLNQCGKNLTCGSHRCERECNHQGMCPGCSNVSFDELYCECGKTTALPPISCGQQPPDCVETCSRIHACDHPVRHTCHSSLSCPPCTELVSKSCPCGQTIMQNVPCFRPIATCGKKCGKQLSRCDHRCDRLCHDGDCMKPDEACKQLCQKIRIECPHTCGYLCHDGPCEVVMSRCSQEVMCSCTCENRFSFFSCASLRSAIILLKSQQNSSYDITLSDDGKVSLTCDADCKRATRNKQLAAALGIKLYDPLNNTFYSSSLKEFAKKNTDFVLAVEKILTSLVEKIRNSTDPVITKSVTNLTKDKIDFIQQYAQSFRVISKPSFHPPRWYKVIIEAQKSGQIQVPKPLLSEAMKDQTSNEQVLSVNATRPQNHGLTVSFLDKVRCSGNV